MLLFALAIVGLLVGLARGGRIKDLTLADLRIWWLAPLALVVQLLPLGDPWALPALMGSYLALVVFAAANVRQPGIPLILLGLAMNWLVIGLNGGMPVDVSGLEDPTAVARLEAEGGAKHHAMTDDDTLAFLGDTLWIAGEAYSPGDLALYAGVAWFIAAGMTSGAQAGVRARGRHAGQEPGQERWGAQEGPPE